MKIQIRPDGPFIVTGWVPLSRMSLVCDEEGLAYAYREEEQYPAQEEYHLCRCGQSGNKPFCDGSHHAGFDGRETSSRLPYARRSGRTEGPALDLTDAPRLCAALRFCDRGGGVWDLTRQSDDPAARQLLVEEVWNCAAGRLVLWDHDGSAIEPVFEPSIVLIDDPFKNVRGPIWVRGGIPVEAADGTLYEVRNRVTLCRCGKSQLKPFCDGNHEYDQDKLG